jgi:hypothetical protein
MSDAAPFPSISRSALQQQQKAADRERGERKRRNTDVNRRNTKNKKEQEKTLKTIRGRCKFGLHLFLFVCCYFLNKHTHRQLYVALPLPW